VIVLGLDRKTHLRKAALTGRVQAFCALAFPSAHDLGGPQPELCRNLGDDV